MSEKIQVRRGTNAERITVTLDQGEPAWTTDTQRFYMGDGVTVGGIAINSIITGSEIITGFNVACVDDLKNIQVTGLVNNSIAYVRSYYSDYTDRGLGGGHFVWKSASTSTEDSGRYFISNKKPSLGRWERLLNGETPNLMMWGARGNAAVHASSTRFFSAASQSNDDTVQIQRALDACRVGFSNQLYCPCSLYRITGTLYWDAQQTVLFGDGGVNGTNITMETGIQQDILVSYGAKAIFDHNANPTIGTDPATVTTTNDVPKIRDIAIGYAGQYHVDFTTPYNVLQNSTNSILTFTLPGESNNINGILLGGGKHAIRIIGPNGPGLRIQNSTIAAQGDSAISVEAINYKTWNGSAWVAATGQPVGVLTVDNCSSDYRGAFYTGYSFIKVQSGANPVIYVKDLKLEGEFSSGVVNYERSYSYNSKIGSIDIDGLNWANGQDHGVEQNVVVIHSKNPNTIHSVGCSIKNCHLSAINNVIKDYIAIGETGLPFTYFVDRSAGLSQENLLPEINYQATRLSHLSDLNWYSSVALYKNDNLQIKFVPNRTGWWRIARGIGNASNQLNHTVSISNYYQESNLQLQTNNILPKSCELYSNSTIYTIGSVPVTRARLLHSYDAWSGTSDSPTFLDIFVNQLIAGSTNQAKAIIINSPQLGMGSVSEQEYAHLINPIFVSGDEILQYGVNYNNYAEVDLTKKQDRGNSVHTSYGNTVLVDKDFHVFLDTNRQLRFFDGGATVTFAGGGGSPQAAGYPIFTNGELKHIILSSTGGGYTSHPTISIIPNTTGIGTGAFASGTISLNGGIKKIVVISGGAGYGIPPLTNNYGYTYVKTGDMSGINLTNSALSGDWQVATSAIPASSTSAGRKGMLAVSGHYLLICTGTNMWGKLGITGY